MNNLRNSGSSSTQLQDFMLLLSGIGSENAEVNEMIAKAKKLYVDQRHTRSISQIHSRDKYRDGRYAFRVAFNRRLCAAHLDDTDRALILGHSVETNERHYSFSDQRRIDGIKKAILDADTTIQ